MEVIKNIPFLLRHLEVSAKRILDVGCGNGMVVRAIAEAGGQVVGLEVNQRQLDDARKAPRISNEQYLFAGGEAIPFPERSFDHVVFFNSLHHIPTDLQLQSLQEAKRVLEPDGTIYVSEPLARGSHFEVMQPAHDETAVRAAAYEALKEMIATGVTTSEEHEHLNPVTYPDYEAFRERILIINPHRKADIESLDSELRRRFDSLGRLVADGLQFDQPMRVVHIIP